jgi:hypothetical protein
MNTENKRLIDAELFGFIRKGLRLKIKHKLTLARRRMAIKRAKAWEMKSKRRR